MEKLENKKYWIWLSTIPNLGPIKTKELLKKHKTPEKIEKLSKEELMQIEGIGEKTVKEILNPKYKKNIKTQINYMQKNNIDIININEKEYPKKLKTIYDPPITLYIKGNKQILNNKALAIIGCRKYSEYGMKTAKYFAQKISEENINIISGLAKGIDSFAHIGTIEGKGQTIAIVGTGLDIIYPKENTRLQEEIIKKGGTIISEYPLGTKPEKQNFPARNRIISGMSDGILVIEAQKKSGTLITVDYALEQGKEVFCIPGNINQINSIGTNDLIKQGAKIVTVSINF